jgi:Tfp pilus assembly protein PilO
MFLILALAALLLGGGLSFFAFNNLGAAKANLEKLQADSKDAKALQKELATSVASLQESATKLQHLEAGVQDYAYVPTMLTDLEKLGKASGIDVTGVRPIAKPPAPKKDDGAEMQTTRKKTYDELDIEVKGRGNYRSVMNFIAALGKFPKIVASRTVEMSPKNDPGQTVSALDVTINLRAYVFATPQPLTPNPSTPQAPQANGQTKTAMGTGANHEG